MLKNDEGIRRGGTPESLAALAPAWDSTDQPAPDITAGNSSQMSDGASAMLIADRATAECAHAGIAAGLRAVARAYARTPYRLGADDDFVADRAVEIEDLCILLAARARGERLPRPGAVLVAERLSGIVALAAAARHANAIALGGRLAPSSLGAAIARAARLPIVAEVAGLFAWARPGDRLLVDGDAGRVHVNPPASAIARCRQRSRWRRDPSVRLRHDPAARP
jgi:phosphoenolpyruvate-protein kinase (PTS system EI component)